MWRPRADNVSTLMHASRSNRNIFLGLVIYCGGVDIHKCFREQGRNNQEWNTFFLTLADYNHLSHYKSNSTGQSPWGHPSSILQILYIKQRRKLLRVLGGDSPVRTIPVKERQIAKLVPCRKPKSTTSAHFWCLCISFLISFVPNIIHFLLLRFLKLPLSLGVICWYHTFY